MSKNRFAGLQAVKKLQQEEREVEILEVSENTTTIPIDEILVKRGRPNGKRSNTEFQQVTAYIRRDTYRKVSIKLLDRENRGEFSELVEDLLQQWLKK